MTGRCFVQSNIGYVFKIMFCLYCNEAKFYESKAKRRRPKILSGNQKGPKSKAKTDRSMKKKGAFDKYFNH